MGPGVDRLDCTEEWFRTPREMAAAILAALPPDWCGHIGVEEVIARAQHDAACRDELARQQAATIARLRRIEEAARAVAECCAVEESWGGQESDDLCATHTALRAALEEKHTDDPATHDHRCIAVSRWHVGECYLPLEEKP